LDIHGCSFPKLRLEAWGLSLAHWIVLGHLFRLLLWLLERSSDLSLDGLVGILNWLWFDGSLIGTGEVFAELEV
jgi:hypothetical protein